MGLRLNAAVWTLREFIPDTNMKLGKILLLIFSRITQNSLQVIRRRSRVQRCSQLFI